MAVSQIPIAMTKCSRQQACKVCIIIHSSEISSTLKASSWCLPPWWGSRSLWKWAVGSKTLPHSQENKNRMQNLCSPNPLHRHIPKCPKEHLLVLISQRSHPGEWALWRTCRVTTTAASSILADGFTLLYHFLNKIHHTTGGPHCIFCFLHGSSPSLEIQSTLIYWVASFARFFGSHYLIYLHIHPQEHDCPFTLYKCLKGTIGLIRVRQLSLDYKLLSRLFQASWHCHIYTSWPYLHFHFLWHSWFIISSCF